MDFTFQPKMLDVRTKISDRRTVAEKFDCKERKTIRLTYP